MPTNPQLAPEGVQTVWVQHWSDSSWSVYRYRPDEMVDVVSEPVEMALLPLDDPRLAPEAGWRGMETAPKDLTEVLVTDGESVEIAQWEMHAADPYWSIDVHDLSRERHETHPIAWRPLPPPPAPETL